MQCEVQSGYSETCMSVYRSEIISACTQTTWQRETSSRRDYIVASYHVLLFELLLVDMDHNCARTGFEVYACTASLPHVSNKNSFHKLICVIQIFMRKIFMVQCHP